jgi:hypothetical protein
MALYEKHNYLNKDISFLISNEIVEYDIKSAGFNLTKKFKLLDEEKISYLESLDKKRRQVQLGLYQKEEKEFGKRLNQAFVEIRKWFFENNNVNDQDVLSIKKDAIVMLRRCVNTELDNIIFVEKNIYTSYYYLNEKEFYYNKDIIHVKGISDDLLELHKKYMLDFLFTFFQMNELSSRKKVIELVRDFAFYYKGRQLDIGYYRELNNQSLFRTYDKLFKYPIGIKHVGEEYDIDISYNYIKYLIPLISILI